MRLGLTVNAHVGVKTFTQQHEEIDLHTTTEDSTDEAQGNRRLRTLR